MILWDEDRGLSGFALVQGRSKSSKSRLTLRRVTGVHSTMLVMTQEWLVGISFRVVGQRERTEVTERTSSPKERRSFKEQVIASKKTLSASHKAALHPFALESGMGVR